MEFIKKNYLYLIFAVSLLGTIISLYFSAILGWVPCVLCWYQRIFLYPIVIISLVAILKKDVKGYCYIMPFAIIGSLVSLFHNLLFWKIIPESLAPCINGVSCLNDKLQLFGFVTIPLLCLIAFLLIISFIIIAKKYENK